MHPRSPSLVAGLRIGGYELVRRIGRGGMAEVWCAKRVSERRTSKFVAIKVVADQYVGDPRFQRMFRSEVELSSLLNHTNIVQVFDEGEDDGRSYVVMEWVDGVNLVKVTTALTFIEDEPWKHRISAYIIGQLLYALGYAHGITLHDGNPLGIVHRDVSPQNVLVSNNGEVKLTDFGVAHHVLDESSGVHVKGKVRYMAPEQLSGHTRDPRVDLYAVGAILHELLDGRRFRHHVEDQRDMVLEVLSGKVPPLSRPVPPELDALRLALLEPDPKNRVPSADAALVLLERFPEYGDARRDLMQLCAGLTGVIRPRVGPGTSQMEVMAAPVEVAASPSTATPDGPEGPSEAERHRSLTLRVLPSVPGAPEPVRNDTSPLPPAVPRQRATAAVRGEVDDVVGGSGALVGAGAERGGPHDVPPDTSVFTASMVRGMVDPSSQREVSTVTAIELPAQVSSPGSTMVARRRESRGSRARMLALYFVLGSLGMMGAFLVWGDEIQESIPEPSKGHASSSEAPRSSPVVPAPEPQVAPVALAPKDPPTPSPIQPPVPKSEAPTSDTSGSLEGEGRSTSSDTEGTPSVESDETIPPAGSKAPGKPKRPTEHSGLIVAVDGTEALVVRVGSSKPVTIESRKSSAFRVPVGKGRRVRWQREGESSWSEHRVDIRAKCELQLRIPSKKTMTLGTCE